MNIFSSKNELSNNYLHPLELDEKTWKNVSQYIYSNLLTEESNKKILKNSLKNMSEKFNELIKSEEETLTIQGLRTALPVKFANIELARKLLSTGDSNIVYSSSNVFLGVNKEGQGQNIYGKLLMEIRKNLRRQANIQFTSAVDNEKKETIYRAYLVKYFLEDVLNHGNDFNVYSKMSVAQIYDMANGDFNSNGPFSVKVYNSFQAYKQSLDKLPKDTILGFVDPEIKMYPKRVVEFVFKKKMRNAQIMLTEKRKNIIYDMYLDHFLTKNNLDNTKVKTLFNSYDKVIQNRENFLKYLETAYFTNKLPQSIQSEISEVVKTIHIPTDKEVETAESVVFNLNERGGDSPTREKDEETEGPVIRPRVRPRDTPTETKEPKPSGKVLTFLDSIFEPFGGKGPERPPSEQKCDKKNTVKSEDIRAILDAVMQGDEIPIALLQKQQVPETYNIVIDSNNHNDIYFELCPVAYDMLKIDTNVGTSKKIDIKMERWFPSVSHYLMFLILKKLMGNTSEAYDVLLKNKTDTKFEFHSNDTINNRYKDLMFRKYQYYLERAIDAKFKDDDDMIDALLQTGDIELLYKDKHDEILGTGAHRLGGNFTGKYLMEVRAKLMATNPVQIKTVLSPVEQLLMDEDEWVESRVKDYCNIILNIGVEVESEILIRSLKLIFPAEFPSTETLPVIPKYFLNMINSEIPSLNVAVKSYIWKSLVDIGNYLLRMSQNPHKMLKDASHVVQSVAFVDRHNLDRSLISNTINNTAVSIIRTIEEYKGNPIGEITNKNLEIATNIILKRSYSTIKDDDFDFSSEGEEGESDNEGEGSDRSIRTPSERDEEEGSDSPKRKRREEQYTEERLNELVEEVVNYDLPEEIKRGRIHYFYNLTK